MTQHTLYIDRVTMIKIIGALAILAIASSHGLSIQPKILGGNLSNRVDVPFFVSMNNFSTCSGTLISDRWVLTAAHCLMFEIPLELQFGIDENAKALDTMQVLPEKQYLHPGFFISNFPTHDIGLMELPREPISSPYIQPIRLPTECGDDLENIEVIAIGNGRQDFSYERGDELVRHIYQTTMTFEDCERAERKHGKPFIVICTSANSTHTIFQGDSGGPLVRRSNGSLIGVASFVDGAASTLPVFQMVNVYTRLHEFYDWISEITGMDLPKCAQ